MRYIFVLIGFLLLAGAVGNQDFYEECRAAADCVAGDPPSLMQTALLSFVGLILMFIGAVTIYAKEEQ